MPKIDLANVEVIRRLVYPEPFYRETEGYVGQRVGNAAGLTQFGVNRAVLPPGGRTALRHWHEAEDEFVIVVSGEVVLRDDDGETLLCAGDCAGFRAGEANGHAIENRSDEPAVLFEIGSRLADETVHYPDVDLRLERRNNARNWIRKDGSPTIKGWLSNAAFGDPAGTVQLEYKHRDCHQPGKQPVGDQFLAAVFHVRPVDPVHEQECDTGKHDKDQTD